MIPRADLTGVVLAGGRSRRMGVNKALLPWEGKTFIEHALAALSPATSVRAIAANDPAAYAFLGLPVWPDVFTGAGPLAGLHAAMLRAPTSHLLVLACDYPLVTAAMALELAAQATPDAITVVSDGAQTQPLFGIYPVRLASSLAEALQAGRGSVFLFLDSTPTPPTILPRPAWRAQLANLNTRADVPPR